MSKIRKMTLLVLVGAAFSLSNMGCKSSGKAGHTEHPAGEHPKGEYPTKKSETPKAEHPKAEHPKGEHPKQP